jgi:chemotaxis protein histidine kinase CheA
MTIFRGVGGGGNSTTDSEITLLTSLAAEASASATLAGLSSAASGVSASNAAASVSAVALSATNAATSASTSVTQASNASTSASAASASASTASTQATNASNSATSASTSASTATTQVSLANSAAALATTKATASGNSALASSLSASTASTQASNAASSASSASTSATNASNSATAASGSASTASTQASNASTSASDAATLTSSAAGYATNALNSANAAANSAASVPADATLVHKTGNETIAGIKTFSSAPSLAGATLTSTVAGGGNQINNVIIGATTPLAGSFTTAVLTSGTVNGVPYLDGSKALTTGSALTYTGTGLGVGASAVFGGGTSTFGAMVSNASGTAGFRLQNTASYAGELRVDSGGFTIETRPNQPVIFGVNSTEVGRFSSTGLAVTGVLTPSADNTRTLGTASLRWSTVYAGTGTINTSDAREKTPVRSLTPPEINAAKQLSKEIGAYQFLSAVAAKGDAAREHIGMTVQRVIEILDANGLEPFNYGFVCYDKWDDVFVEHEAIKDVDAWTEQTQKAGERYAFRLDELLMFISRGFEARLATLEAT